MKILLVEDSYIERHRIGGYLPTGGSISLPSEAVQKRSSYWKVPSLPKWFCSIGCCPVSTASM